ncbi:acylneuraminate cytidylyltransferase family protein [Marinobacter sp. PE14]
MRLAVIPARGGSKRLPGKNIKLLGGKPLIQWTIDAAVESKVFDRVCVSTDSEEIANIALRSGAEVPFMRPAEFASDTSTTAGALANFIDVFEKTEGCTVNYVCLLQPTSPLRTAGDIINSERLLTSENLDAVVSVCEMEHPIQLCNTLPPDHSLTGFVKSIDIKRSQELDIYYRLNGAIYFCKSSVAKQLGKIYSEGIKSKAYIMKSINSIDIDTELDFQLAEVIANNFSKK